MSGNDQQSSSSDRYSRIQALVEDCLLRRAAGEAVSDQSLIDSHPELMPELGRELKKSQQIAAALARNDVETDHSNIESVDALLAGKWTVIYFSRSIQNWPIN